MHSVYWSFTGNVEFIRTLPREAKEISRGPRDCPMAKTKGNLEGRGVQNPRPREISRAEGDVFPNASRLEAVYVHSLSISREVLILWWVFHLQAHCC